MSDLVDKVFGEELKQRPAAVDAYLNDATIHAQWYMMRGWLAVVEASMRREGSVYADTAERVLRGCVVSVLDEWERSQHMRSAGLFSGTEDAK